MRHISQLRILLLLCLLSGDSFSEVSHTESSLLVLSLVTQVLYHSHDVLLGDINHLPLKHHPAYRYPSSQADNKHSTTTRLRSKKLQLKLEKLIIKLDKDGNGTSVPVICSICTSSYASTHTECCRRPVCRRCMISNSSKDACTLCRTRKCYICLEFKPNIISARCCRNSICELCLIKCTQVSNWCPYCKQSICDKPLSNKGTVQCPTCTLWVSRKGFTDHQLSIHPTSEEWAQDYQYCAQCKVYVHPQMEAVHLTLHGGDHVRGARHRALALILQSAESDVEPDCINDIDDEGLGSELTDDIGDFEGGIEEGAEEDSEAASQLSCVVCPICQQQVNNEDLTEHMGNEDHIYSEVETLWHRYCRSCKLYIRGDFYPIHHDQ